MITGLEIGSIVVGCVNAGLGAAKLISDWYNRRQERRASPANIKLERALRSDASTIDTAYRFHLSEIKRHGHGRRFEVGDEPSHAAIAPKERKFRAALRDLKAKLKGTRAKVLPDAARILAASNDLQATVVRALARLHRRIIYETRVPRSLNPLRLFGFRKNRPRPPSAPLSADSAAAPSSLRLPAAAASAPALPGVGDGGGRAEGARREARGLPWEVEAPGVHAQGCPCAAQTVQCNCAAAPGVRQVFVVESMYVNGSQNNAQTTNVVGKEGDAVAAKAKRAARARAREMEIVLFRRPAKGKR